MDKNKVLKTNISFGLFYKFISLLFIYLTVPALLDYLGAEYYGIWVTIFALLNAAYFMDLGISLGLKNKLTESLAKNDLVEAKIYISTAYLSIIFISIIILFFALTIISFLDLQEIFNTSIGERELKITVLVSTVLVVISIVLNIYKSLLHAFQKAAKVELAMAVYQVLIFLQILLLPNFIDQPLLIIGVIYGFTNISVAIIFSVLFFYKNRALTPSLSHFKKDKINKILGLGAKFFVIQLALIMILTTDNIIITYLIGPEETTTYSIINKVYQPFIIISTFIFSPLWTLYTKAYYDKDFLWIKKTFKKLNLLFVLLILILIVLYFNFDWIIKLWIPEPLYFSKTLLIGLSFFVLAKIYSDIYLTFLNGIGVINLQMWLFVFGAIINIPLSVLFVKYFDLGTTGVIFATGISIFILTIAMPIQAYLILKNKNLVMNTLDNKL
jgi:O-antigen/teichoic acid export membrane protein